MNKKGKLNLSVIAKNNFTQIMLIIETIIIFAVFQFLTGGTFLTSRNLTNLLMQSCVYAIMGIGIVFVMVSGNMDLSGGSVLGFLSALGATLQVSGQSTVVTILVMLIAGIFIGAWQGFWISYMRLPAFIVTLAGMLVFRGLCLLVGGGATVGPVSDSFEMIGSGYLPTISSSGVHDTTIILFAVIIVIMILMMMRSRNNQRKYDLPVDSTPAFVGKIAIFTAILVVVALILNDYRGIPDALLLLGILACIFTYVSKNTVFGRQVFAIGGNVEATKLSGINTKKTVMKVYILMGLLVAIASIVYLGRVGQATASAGKDFEFSAITGCIVGGVSCLGGIGSVPYAILGTVLMSGLDNGMSLMNVGSTGQYIVRGLVLLFAVAIDVISKTKKS